MIFTAGQKVRLIDDPSSQGTITGRTRERAGTIYYKVHFNTHSSFQPDYVLELIKENEDWDQLLEKKQYGRPVILRQHLTHIYLNGKLANLVYSMGATTTDFYAYQFKPVLSFLESPSNGLLIADEVGLGKTIEAGLVWTELKAREDAKNLLVICPAMLRDKWVDELETKFGEDARIMNSTDLLAELKRTDYIGRPKVFVCSIQGLRPPKNWRDENLTPTTKSAQLARFLEQQSTEEPILDMLIIDEAHYLRNKETKSNKLGVMLTNISKNNLLLSATPINLDNQDLFQLLHLIDPDNFDDLSVFPSIIDANEPLLRAKTLALNPNSESNEITEQLNRAQKNILLRNNRQLASILESDIDKTLESEAQRVRLADRIDNINLLKHAFVRTRKKDILEHFQIIRKVIPEFIDFDPNGPELDFYNRVSAAIRSYAKAARLPPGFLLSNPQRQLSSCMVAAVQYWQQVRIDNEIDAKLEEESLYETLGYEVDDDIDPKKVMPLVEHIQEQVLPYINIDDLRNGDSKFARFLEVIKNTLDKDKNEKIIVFSYFRNTLFYLEQRLNEENISTEILMGGMKNKQEIINTFRENKKINILLSTEVASEGVDLQFSKIIVNYDLPWNPMKIEQRIGRIDRLGQQSDQILIWNLLHSGTVDERIYNRLLRRLKIFERALGGVNDVVGQEIKQLHHDMIFGDLSEEEQEEKIKQAAIAIENRRDHEEKLEAEASSLIAHGGYILEQVQAAYDFNKRITDNDLQLYTRDYLNTYVQGHRLEYKNPEQDLYLLSLPINLMNEITHFIDENKLNGLSRIGSDPSIMIKFENKVGFDPNRKKYETINQFHPLIRFISDDLERKGESFHPLIAASLSTEDMQSSIDPGIYFFALNKWAFSGLKTEEELRARVIRLGDSDYKSNDESWEIINTTRVKASDWLTVDADLNKERIDVEEILDDCIYKLDEDFNESKTDRETANLDRIQFQRDTAIRKSERRLEMLYQRLENYRSQQKERMVPATLGQIEAQERRTAIKIKELEQREQMSSNRDEICVGVIRIQ